MSTNSLSWTGWVVGCFEEVLDGEVDGVAGRVVGGVVGGEEGGVVGGEKGGVKGRVGTFPLKLS